MSAPEEQDWRKVKRIGRYLKGNKRGVYKYRNQKMPDRIVVWSDSVFAGCKSTED